MAALATLKLGQQVMLALAAVAQLVPGRVAMDLQILALAAAVAGTTLKVETVDPALLSCVI